MESASRVGGHGPDLHLCGPRGGDVAAGPHHGRYCSRGEHGASLGLDGRGGGPPPSGRSAPGLCRGVGDLLAHVHHLAAARNETGKWDHSASARRNSGAIRAGCEEDCIMSESLPMVYLARHGETGWSLSGQHTGRTEYFLESGALALLLLGWHKIGGDTHG